MGATTAPVTGSGSDPTWMALVAKCWLMFLSRLRYIPSMRLSRVVGFFLWVVKFDRCWEERRSISLKRTKRMSSCTLTVLVAIFMALICPQVQSFAPRSSPSLQKRSVTRSHSTHLKMAVVPPGVAAVAAAPIMYGLMSINEYMTHRWYQHAEISKVGWWKALRMPKVKGGGMWSTMQRRWTIW